MKIIILWPTLMSVALLTGCAGKTVYMDRMVEVKVPVPCKMKEVKPATTGANDAVTTADIVRERDELRKSNDGCR